MAAKAAGATRWPLFIPRTAALASVISPGPGAGRAFPWMPRVRLDQNSRLRSAVATESQKR
jgi:hypothetical protein